MLTPRASGWELTILLRRMSYGAPGATRSRERPDQDAFDTVDMLKSGMRSAGMAVRVK